MTEEPPRFDEFANVLGSDGKPMHDSQVALWEAIQLAIRETRGKDWRRDMAELLLAQEAGNMRAELVEIDPDALILPNIDLDDETDAPATHMYRVLATINGVERPVVMVDPRAIGIPLDVAIEAACPDGFTVPDDLSDLTD